VLTEAGMVVKMLKNTAEFPSSNERIVTYRSWLYTTFLNSFASFESKSAKRNISEA
jgi:hypothetical protein